MSGLQRRRGVASVNGLTGAIAVTLATLGAEAALPAGAVIMWYGSALTIPTGWALCDGTAGTPDLRDRFIIGALGAHAVGNIGGSASTASNSQGAHTHGGTTGGHSLTVAELAAHTHTQSAGGNDSYGFIPDSVGPPDGGSFSTRETHEETASTGSGDAHTHTIGSDGAHTHTTATVPPFMALCFIIKV